MNYATLTEARLYTGAKDPTKTQDDAILIKALSWAKTLIDLYKGRRYDPVVATRKFDLPGPAASTFGVFDSSLAPRMGAPAVMRLKTDLLELHELLNGDGSVVDALDFVLEPANRSPKTRIRLLEGGWMPSENGHVHQVIGVTGIWGTHDQWEEAWCDSLDTVQDSPLTAGATSLTVADADGIAANLSSPRFQAGQLIRIGSEYGLVIVVNATSNTLTIARGQNGTSTAQHSQGTKIEIFQPMGIINQVCLRLTKWRYSQKDVDTFDRTYAIGAGTVTVPTGLPRDVTDILGAPGKAEL